jgi:hypothetical protein
MQTSNSLNPDEAQTTEISEEEIQEWFEEEEEAEQDELLAPAVGPESIADKYTRSQLRVVRETKDFTLDYLQHALKSDAYIINVAPEYQRRQRWTAKKRSQLIESFLMNIPIPPAFLFERDYNAYEVIDGRQRLDSIRDFLSNNFALTGLRYWTELNRKRFNQLPAVIQKGLLRRSLSAVVLLAETRSPIEDDFDVRTILFDRLNTGGEKLNPQELRNALYPGPFNDMLIDVARSDPFTFAWGIPSRSPDEPQVIPDILAKNTLYRTMADCELVLRFFAIREALVGHSRGSLRRILDSCMRRHNEDSEETTTGLKHHYLTCLSALTEVFEGKPFRLLQTNRPSRPLYDALMVALSLAPGLHSVATGPQVRASLKEALTTEAGYDVLVGRGNTVDAIRQRVNLASKILSGSAAT